MESYHYQIAATLVRIILGILLFMQGFDKVFHIRVKGVADTFQFETQGSHLSRFFILSAAFYTSYAEFLGGLFLMVGLFTYASLYIIAIDLLIACFGMSYREPLWDMKHVWPRMAMLIFLLAIPVEWNQWSIDTLFKF